VVISLAGLGALGALTGLAVALARAPLARMFTSDPAIVSLVEPLLPLAAGALVFFSLEFTAIGTLLGQGRALPVSLAVLAGNWLVCVPLAFVFSRVLGWGLTGIWWALLAGYAVVTVISCLLLWRSDWPTLRDEAVARSRSEEENAAALAASVAAEAEARSGGGGGGGGGEDDSASKPLLP
jgi:Na+-driven multidrug efflux pump